MVRTNPHFLYLAITTICWLYFVPGCDKKSVQVSPAANVIKQPKQEVESTPFLETSPDVVSTVLVEPERESWQMRDAVAERLEAGDIVAAGREIRAAVRVSPDDPENIFLMAIVLGEERRYHEAVRMLDRLSQKVAETRLPALGQTADWLVKQGEWSQAEERYRIVLNEVPDAVMALRQLSQLLIRQGRRLDAAEYLLELCRLGNVEEVELSTLLRRAEPFSSDAVLEQYEPIHLLGHARMMIGKQDVEGALQILSSESSLDAACSALLGRIYAEQRDADRLHEWVAKQSEDSFDCCDGWFALGIDHANQGDHELAVQQLCKVVVQDSTDKQAYLALGVSLQALGAASESKRAYERAQWIARTLEIGDLMAGTSERDPILVMELIQLLDKLHRPFEALAWQAVLLAYGQPVLSENQRQSRVAEINQQRLRWLQAEEPPASEDFLVCGVDKNSFGSRVKDNATET